MDIRYNSTGHMKYANIISLFKNKGERSDCGNYRGISLLSVAGKILARVAQNRLIKSIFEKHLSESHCCFRSDRDTVMIFTLRQIQEKCREQNKNLYMLFIDLTKVFDTVNRRALWKVLSSFGCPNHLRQFHGLRIRTMLGIKWPNTE